MHRISKFPSDMADYPEVERRTSGIPEGAGIFWQNLKTYLDQEQKKFSAVDTRMDIIAKELKPLQKLYHAFLFGSSLLAVIAALMIYIYQSDKESNRKSDDQLAVLIKTVDRLSNSTEIIVINQSNLRRDMDKLDAQMKEAKR